MRACVMGSVDVHSSLQLEWNLLRSSREHPEQPSCYDHMLADGHTRGAMVDRPSLRAAGSQETGPGNFDHLKESITG